MKLMRGIDQDLVQRHITYTSYYRADELPGLLVRRRARRALPATTRSAITSRLPSA